MPLRKSTFGVILVLCAPILGAAEEWHQFRGPGSSGVATAGTVPQRWSSDKNVVWRTELPGLGTSSPIVVGERVFLTTYSGYGLLPSEGEMSTLVRHVVCLNRQTGKINWAKEFTPRLPESSYSGGNNSRHGYSSSTPATDGERLYVFFGKSGVYCLDLEGNEIWHSLVGDGTTGWGSSNSPVLFENLVIINASVESGSLVALDKSTGSQVWQTGGIRKSWNTPALVTLKSGESELVVSTEPWLLGIDPLTGKELWRCDAIPTYACPSAVSNEGIVYLTGGRGTQYTLAVRAGGRGDVTSTHRLWKTAKGSNVSSPIYDDGHLYMVNDSKGIAYCFDAQNGEVIYQTRLTPRPDLMYASALLANGNVYYQSQHEGTYVVAAKPTFELVAHNVLETEGARSNASPVPDKDRLLLRNDRYLVCLGNGL